MNKKVLIALLALMLGGGWFIWTEVRQSRKAREDLVLYGNVDIREVNLGFRVSGKVQEVLRDEGDAVKAGEVLARLDREPFEREVQEAQAQAQSLNVHLGMLRSGYRKEDIDQAQASLKEREAAVVNAERTLIRKKDLADRKVVPPQEYDDAVAARDQAQARLASGRAALALQSAGYRPEEIAQAEADAAKAEAALDSSRLRLADTELKASCDGVVTTRALEPGAIVQAGATVLTVSLNAPLWIRAYVHEPELGRVHPGTKAQVFTDSRPDRPFEAKVGYVSPRAEFTPKNVETTELRTALVYRLRVIIDTPDPSLRQGMPVTVKLSRD